MSGQITALKVQKHNQQRVNVYIDGEFAFGLAAIEALRLKVGQYLSAADIARLKEQDQGEIAYERALNLLSYRPRSVAEVRRNLTGKFDAETVENVISRLRRADLLDDGAFVRYWIENRDTFKPRGSQALRYELRQKGIADALIDDALTDYDEEAAARRAALAQVHKLARRHDVETVRAKLLAFLNRRGFSFHVAREITADVLSEIGGPGVERADTHT